MAEIPIISIVDDDESVREAVKNLIRSTGFRAEVFTSAEEFLNSSHLHETACLILDVRMPGMNGLELQRRLAASNFAIPIILISAHSDGEAQARALQAGAVDFLYKPFTEDALLNAIKSSLATHREDIRHP